jgi:hypothetical protein
MVNVGRHNLTSHASVGKLAIAFYFAKLFEETLLAEYNIHFVTSQIARCENKNCIRILTTKSKVQCLGVVGVI